MGADQVVQTPFGKFLVNDQDLIESTLKAGTLWDGPGFLQVIAKQYARLGEAGVTVLDVGANVGSFSVWLAHHGAWRVLAVEPVPGTMQRLKANLDLNRDVCAGVVVPIEVAAYHRCTSLVVVDHDPRNVGGTALRPLDEHEAPTRCIPAVCLDQYQWLAPHVSLIKIDTEGCDGVALRGLEQTIARDHPAIVFEWEATLALPHGYTLGDALAWLRGAWGYTVHEWPSQPGNYLAVWEGIQ